MHRNDDGAFTYTTAGLLVKTRGLHHVYIPKRAAILGWAAMSAISRSTIFARKFAEAQPFSTHPTPPLLLERGLRTFCVLVAD